MHSNALTQLPVASYSLGRGFDPLRPHETRSDSPPITFKSLLAAALDLSSNLFIICCLLTVMQRDLMTVSEDEYKGITRAEWVKRLVDQESYFFHSIELPNGIVTPGWSNPKLEKLPFFGLPDDMSGMRVLDIGCAEGFFSFEAERRGAREVVAIDSFPDGVRRFNICRDALDSRVQVHLASVYDISARTYGTFDLVMFFGVLYHLRNPVLALEKIFSVCSGKTLLQTANIEDPTFGERSLAEFHPFGISSGPPDNPMLDPTVFWVPNAACVRDLMLHAGFVNVEGGAIAPVGSVFSADVPTKSRGEAPDQMKAPWC